MLNYKRTRFWVITSFIIVNDKKEPTPFIIYYLYPENSESENLQLNMNRGSRYEKNLMPRDDIQVIKLGLRIPANTLSFHGDEGFYIRMKASEAEFIKQFSTV